MDSSLEWVSQNHVAIFYKQDRERRQNCLKLCGLEIIWGVKFSCRYPPRKLEGICHPQKQAGPLFCFAGPRWRAVLWCRPVSLCCSKCFEKYDPKPGYEVSKDSALIPFEIVALLCSLRSCRLCDLLICCHLTPYCSLLQPWSLWDEILKQELVPNCVGRRNLSRTCQTFFKLCWLLVNRDVRLAWLPFLTWVSLFLVTLL